MVSRTNRELSAEDIGRIADTHHAWRGEDADFRPYEDTPASPGFSHEDVPGFRAAADLDAIRDHNRALIPGQYIGSEPVKGDREPLDEKIARLTAGIGGWLYRPPGLRRRHDRAGRWDFLAGTGSAFRSRLFRSLLAPMRVTAGAGTLLTWRCSGS